MRLCETIRRAARNKRGRESCAQKRVDATFHDVCEGQCLLGTEASCTSPVGECGWVGCKREDKEESPSFSPVVAHLLAIPRSLI